MGVLAAFARLAVRGVGQVYDVLFSNLTLFLADSPAVDVMGSHPSDVSFQFIGLPESLMRDFRFEGRNRTSLPLYGLYLWPDGFLRSKPETTQAHRGAVPSRQFMRGLYLLPDGT